MIRAFAYATTIGLFTMLSGSASAQNAPKYSADVPAWIATPDKVDTRIGTLRFHNGAPDEETVKLVYDQLDFSRGVDAFLTGIPTTSVRAACNGLEKAGIKKNEAFGITEDLMDARSLFLTPNTTTVYVFNLSRPCPRSLGSAGADRRPRAGG